MENEFNADRLMVKVFADRGAMGEAAGREAAARINQLLNQQDVINIIFAAAPSQNEFLGALVKSAVDWRRVRAFHMDEYVGLPDAAPQRFGNFLKEKIFEKLPFLDVYYLQGNATDIDEECKRYTLLLQQYPVDIVCMGIGENGHIAFNDPPVANFRDAQWVKPVELEEACRQQQVNDKCFSSIDQVPASAITLTIPALMASKYIYCMVPGPTKANAVYNTIYQPVMEQYPATILRTHAAAVLYLDALSSARLAKKDG